MFTVRPSMTSRGRTDQDYVDACSRSCVLLLQNKTIETQTTTQPVVSCNSKTTRCATTNVVNQKVLEQRFTQQKGKTTKIEATRREITMAVVTAIAKILRNWQRNAERTSKNNNNCHNSNSNNNNNTDVGESSNLCENDQNNEIGERERSKQKWFEEEPFPISTNKHAHQSPPQHNNTRD